jgi:tRNA A-37 threonylcarbamoyl transferase component Bud32
VSDAPVIIRLAPTWDNPAIRAQLSGIVGLLTAQPPEAVIYRGRNVLTRLEIGSRQVVVKAFPAPRTLLKRLQRVGRASKAVRAFDHAERMTRLGIGTPEPLATLEADDGRAWFVCAWADDCTTVRHLNREQGPAIDHLCTALGGFVGYMHHRGAFHFDSTPGNILLRRKSEPAEFQVVDCNRMRFGHVGRWAGLGSLVQLDAQGRLLESYCAARGWNPTRLRWLYRLRLNLERWSRALKNATRPLRRKLGL